MSDQPMTYEKAAQVVDGAIKRHMQENGIKSYPEAYKDFTNTPRGKALVEAYKNKKGNRALPPMKTQLETTMSEVTR